MPTIQYLKKKLRGIKSTQKIAKAMKTSSTDKFGKLHNFLDEYSEYSKEYRDLYLKHAKDYNAYFAAQNPSAPVCLIVITANKGMCGSFNSQVLKFASEVLDNSNEDIFLIPCGKKAIDYFDRRNIPYEKAFIFNDVPKFSEACELFGYLTAALKAGRISTVKLAYPKYYNMMTQAPVLYDMFVSTETDGEGDNELDSMYFPDKEAVITATADKLMEAFIFDKILESSLGAQASTLMTMRTAYDTATEYRARLEAEINKKRQSQVTADVIETSAEHSQEN